MATIHKLTKDGATIFPATITDAVVHPQTGKTLTSMMKDYNVSELFPTEGIDGGNKYTLALAIQVLGTHLSAAQKTGGIKLTFISSVTPYPEEEYYLGKSNWSATASDWDQRFEVGDVVADPSGSWEPSTAQQYIDQQVGTINSNLTSETIARQNGDRNLQTNLTSEMNTRASQDANLNALINAGIREGGGVEFDIVPTQNSANGITSGGMYNTLKDSNIGFVDEVPTAGSDNLVKSNGVWSDQLVTDNKIGEPIGSIFNVTWLGEGWSINTDTGMPYYQEGNNRNATDIIPIKFDTISIKHGSNVTCLILYYGKNGIISNSGWIFTLVDNNKVNFPNGTIYYRVVAKTDVSLISNFSFISLGNGIYEMKDEILSINTQINNINWMGQGWSVNVSSGIPYNDETSINRNATELTPTKNLNKIIINGTSSKFTLCFYDEFGNFIGSNYWITSRVYYFSQSQYFNSSTYFRLSVDTSVMSIDDIFIVSNYTKNLAIKNTIIVDANGFGDYTTVEDALNNSNDSVNHHVTILVKQGTYVMPQKVSGVAPYVETGRNLTIIGENKNTCILKNDIGFYDYTIETDCSVLRLNGNVVIKNLTIISGSSQFDNYVNTPGYIPRDNYRKASYCIHRDGVNYENSKFVIDNCVFINDHFTCIGFGLKPNTELIINDCYLCSEQASEYSNFNLYGTIYGHYAAGAKGLGQNLSIIRSQIVNKTSERAIDIKDAKASDATPSDTFGTFKFIGNSVNTTILSDALSIANSLEGFYRIDPLSFGNKWEL